MGSDDPWTGREPCFSTTARQVLSRAARHPLRTTGLAVLVAALVVAVRASGQPRYEATLTFRIAERTLQDAGTAPSPPASLRDYIADVVLTRGRLLALMERHDLSPRWRKANPIEAAEALRDELDVTVSRNYFLLDRTSSDEPRSAQVVLSYASSDAEQARAVVHDLATLVLERQAATRNDSLSQVAAGTRAEKQRAREQLAALQEQRARLALRHASAPDPEAVADLALLEHQIGRAVARVRAIETRGAAVDLTHEAEAQQLGYSFELVDESVRAVREPAGGWRRAGIGALAFSLALPVIAVVAGAFDRRVYAPADVVACGCPVLAALPPLPGDGG